jgi:hypothetical protein
MEYLELVILDLQKRVNEVLKDKVKPTKDGDIVSLGVSLYPVSILAIEEHKKGKT